MFEPSPDLEHKTEVIVHMMHATPIGGSLTYQDMRERLNEPVTSQYAALRLALDAAKAEGMVFVNIPGEGYRRLSDGETATVGMAIHRKKLFRAAKRGIRTATAIKDMSRLTSEERNHLWATRGVLETVRISTHGNSVNARMAKAPSESALDKELRRLSGEAQS